MCLQHILLGTEYVAISKTKSPAFMELIFWLERYSKQKVDGYAISNNIR